MFIVTLMLLLNMCRGEKISDEDLFKFDCLPEDGNEKDCLKRGCLWKKLENNPMNIPKCYYDPNAASSYKEEYFNATEGVAVLKHVNSSSTYPYTKLMEKIKIEFYDETDTRLRIKFSDSSAKRYEVPISKHFKKKKEKPSNTKYSHEYNPNDGSVKIFVKRNKNKVLIWDTSVGSLMMSDQFLQISAKIPSTYLYGLGETSRSTFKRDFSKWSTFGLFSRDQAPYPHHGVNLYGVHPFYMIMEEDGSAHGVLLLNSNAMDITLQPLPAITYRTIGGVLDFYFFVGPTPSDVVRQYTELVGRPAMPAYWSLGFQLCRYGYNSLDEVKKTVQRMSKYDIPQDVQYGDIDYMDRQLDFTYNKQTYDGLPQYVKDIKSMGIKYITILDPAISAEEKAGTYETYELGTKLDIWIKDHNNKTLFGKVWPDKPGVYVNKSWPWDEQTKYFRANATFPDWFHRDIREWWNVMIDKFHDIIPFDGLWIDMNEAANFVSGSINGCPNNSLENPPYKPKILNELRDKTICMSALHQDGESEYNYHSLFGWKQTVITEEALRATTKKRGIVISRSTYPSSGKHAGHWLGDNKSAWPQMHESIIGMMDFTLFGIPYIGADICGFNENTTYELCLRWMHLGAFYPFSRNHNGITFMVQDPASFDEKFAKSSRDILHVRYTLLPYLYTLFHKAHVDGNTVVTPLFHVFPQDKTTWTIDQQFMWGNGLLIAPVLEKDAVTADVYLPKARWYDYFTSEEVESSLIGEKSNSWDIPMDKIGLFIKGGTVIPTQQPANNTLFSRKKPFSLIIAYNDNQMALGSLFWDDGETIDTLQTGNYLQIRYYAFPTSLSIRVDVTNYTDINDLHYEQFKFLGFKGKKLLSLKVNGEDVNDVDYDLNNGVLSLNNLNLPIKVAHEITWEVDSSSKADINNISSFNLAIVIFAWFLFR